MKSNMTRRDLIKCFVIGTTGTILASCQPKIVEVEKIVKETVEVEKIVEKEVTKVVEKEVTKVVEKEVTSAPAAVAVTEIRITHSWPAEQWPRQEQVDETFNQEHADIHATSENLVWADYVPKLTAAAAAGTMPEVMYCQFAWSQKFIMDGAAKNLQPFLENDPEFWEDGKDFVPQALQSFLWQGDLYYIPMDEGATNLIYYNKRLFDEAGYPYPNSDKDWTLEDLLVAAKALTGGEGEEKIWGFNGMPSMGGALNQDYLVGWGGQFWSDPCETSSRIHEPEAVAALSWWAKLRTEFGIMPTPAEAQTVPGNPFAFGRVAMHKGAPWDNRWIKASLKDPYDVAHGAIQPDGKRHASAMNSGYGITKDCKPTAAAWEYLRTYLGVEGQIFMWASTGISPGSRWSSYPAYLASPLAPASANVFMEALADYARHEIIDSPGGREITNTATPLWDRALLQEISVQEACDQITAAVTPVMKENEEWCKLAFPAGS